MSIKVALWIDSSDFINEESDEALEYLLDKLDELGIRASFKMVGAKVRALKEHGRDDLLKRLSVHDIGYHTDYHSIHPVITEYTNDLSFSDGAKAFEEVESKGLNDVRELIGRTLVGFGQPGEAWAPDVCPPLLKQGITVFLDTHYIINLDTQPFEFGGIINLNNIARIIRCEYKKENGLSEAIEEYERLCEEEHGYKEPETAKVFSIFYHPCEFCNKELFWDWENCKGGKNQYEEYNNGLFFKTELVSREVEHERIDVVCQYLKYIVDSGAEFVTMSDFQNMIRRRNVSITRSDVLNIAKEIVETGEIGFYEVGGEFVSASEVFQLLYRYLSGKPLSTMLVYGPETRETSLVKAKIKKEDVLAVMGKYDTVMGFPQLKSLYNVGDCKLTPSDICYAAAKLLVENVDECEAAPCLCSSEKYVNPNSDWSGHWLFGDSFDVTNTYEKTRLQCWTLKPLRLD